MRLFILVIVVLSPLDAAWAEALDPRLRAAGWDLYSDSRWPAARFDRRSDGAIAISTDDSTALIYRMIASEDQHRRISSWRWMVEQPMAPTDISVKGGDDRPIALHVWFMEDPEQADLFDRLAGAVAEAVVGFPVHGKVLTYVWGGLGLRGDRQANPHIDEDSSMIVLRPGAAPAGRWFEEEVDIAADFEAAFGYPPPAQIILALAADAEDTDAMSRAVIADIAFRD